MIMLSWISMVETNLTEPPSSRIIFDIFLIVYLFLNITYFLINFISKVNPKLTIHILPYFVLLYQLALLILLNNNWLIDYPLKYSIFTRKEFEVI